MLAARVAALTRSQRTLAECRRCVSLGTQPGVIACVNAECPSYYRRSTLMRQLAHERQVADMVGLVEW